MSTLLAADSLTLGLICAVGTAVMAAALYFKETKLSKATTEFLSKDHNNYRSDLIEDKSKTEVLRHVLHNESYLQHADLLFLMDLSSLRSAVQSLKNAFPSNAIHAFAIKANPASGFLRLLSGLGIGAEAASWTEVAQALRCGFPASQIIFDSPSKTKTELRAALQAGVHINLDNLEELADMAQLVKNMSSDYNARQAHIGIRINTQHGAGRVAAISTATLTSKFGVALKRNRAELLEAYCTYPWLTGIHCHGGSHGCGLDMLVDGVRVMMDFVADVNAARAEKGFPPLSLIDIGGGVPAAYTDLNPKPIFAEYAHLLRQRVPELFCTGPAQYTIATEMGRSLSANFGWTVARVQRVKATGDPQTAFNIAVTDYGADCDVRNVYMPGVFHRRLSVYDRVGTFRETHKLAPQDLAGPLCFSGDMLAKQRLLPPISAGDLLVIHNTGGYTLALWSRYNSRTCPAMVGYEHSTDRTSISYSVLKAPEALEDVLRFWD